MTDQTTTEPRNLAVHRHAVPVDDKRHMYGLTGPILHIAARTPNAVEFWTLATEGPAITREFRVYGTGHPLPPEGIRHVGTALAADGALVWHLFEWMDR